MDKINDLDTLDKMISKTVRERSSKRNFLPNAVSIDTVKEIIKDASRAPSGTNTQPWKVTCVTGETKKKLTNAVLEAADSGNAGLEYEYMPSKLKESLFEYNLRWRKFGRRKISVGKAPTNWLLPS